MNCTDRGEDKEEIPERLIRRERERRMRDIFREGRCRRKEEEKEMC